MHKEKPQAAGPTPFERFGRETSDHSAPAGAAHTSGMGKAAALNHSRLRQLHKWVGSPPCYIEGSHTDQLHKGATHEQ